MDLEGTLKGITLSRGVCRDWGYKGLGFKVLGVRIWGALEDVYPLNKVPF